MSNGTRTSPGGAVQLYLEEDHRRLEGLLEEALLAAPGDRKAYDGFRLGLLRHIALEERILATEARKAIGHAHPLSKRLSLDHSLLATLLIPSPTRPILLEIQEILKDHDLLEEGQNGYYKDVEGLLEGRVEEIAAALRSFPDPRPAPNLDREAVLSRIQDLRQERRNRLTGPVR